MADTDYTDEEWRAIPGYEGRYDVSSFGRVRSLSRIVRYNRKDGSRIEKPHRGRILSPSTSVGYPSVALEGEGHKIHRLVCLAFHGLCPSPRHLVTHLDGSRTNNAPSNVQWRTQKENVADSIRHGTFAYGERRGTSKLKNNQVLDIRRLAAIGTNRQTMAAKFNISEPTLSEIINRKTWRHLA